MIKFLEDNKILYDRQFGFRCKHSTVHGLITITEDIKKSIDNGKLTCEVFIDLQKAFDTVDHKILLKKLEIYGFRGITNDWFSTYLSGRKHSTVYVYVSVSGADSNYRDIKHGVPQGSVLGPILFLIYINDLANRHQSSSVPASYSVWLTNMGTKFVTKFTNNQTTKDSSTLLHLQSTMQLLNLFSLKTIILPVFDYVLKLNIILAHQILNRLAPIAVQQTINLEYLLDRYLTRGKQIKLLKDLMRELQDMVSTQCNIRWF